MKRILLRLEEKLAGMEASEHSEGLQPNIITKRLI